MKKCLSVFLTLVLVFSCVSALAEMRTVADYSFTLQEGDTLIWENTIFPADVIISGDHAVAMFTNCWFAGDIILTADEATRVMLFGCQVNGHCILQNNTQEASLEYNNPKFLTDSPIHVLCNDCVGSVAALGDFEVTFNGEPYTLSSSALYAEDGYTLTKDSTFSTFSPSCERNSTESGWAPRERIYSFTLTPFLSSFRTVMYCSSVSPGITSLNSGNRSVGE